LVNRKSRPRKNPAHDSTVTRKHGPASGEIGALI